jgi:hypothetical protein
VYLLDWVESAYEVFAPNSIFAKSHAFDSQPVFFKVAEVLYHTNLAMDKAWYIIIELHIPKPFNMTSPSLINH